MDQLTRELLQFIEDSPCSFFAVENIARELTAEGYEELTEGRRWALVPGGKYFLRRNGSSLLAFRIPRGEFRGFMMLAAHSDSPGFQIKESCGITAGGYHQLNTEKYGGMLCSSWMDRPLSVAGRVTVREAGALQCQLVNLRRDLCLIPQVAIHMDRSANDGKAYNPNCDMLPLLGLADGRELEVLLCEELGIEREALVSKELYLYPRTPGTVWGAEEEFISSPRLDDLQCAFACLRGFLQGEECAAVPVYCLFDNEEVGSGTKQGADSTLLEDVLCRIGESLGLSAGELRAKLADSFLLSADNAHAVHPNHPEYADRNDRPAMNGGVVLKYSAAQRYTTDGVSAAIFRELCREAGVPVQIFTNRNDLPGGSTLGHISAAHVSVRAADIGLAQLAMHSSYETAGVKDTEYLLRAARAFCSHALRWEGERVTLE